VQYVIAAIVQFLSYTSHRQTHRDTDKKT